MPGGRSRNGRRSRTSTGRRDGLAHVTVCFAGFAIGALAILTLVGCSSPSRGTGHLSVGAGSTTPAPVVTPPGSPPPTSARPQGTPSAAPGPLGALVDVVRVEKCWTTATHGHGGQLLVKASSSDPAAHLLVYGSDGSLIGEVQNGGGGRYGGSVMTYQRSDPGRCVVRSSDGGTSSAPTGPFQPGS